MGFVFVLPAERKMHRCMIFRKFRNVLLFVISWSFLARVHNPLIPGAPEASEAGNLSRPRPAQPSFHVVAALRDVLQLLLDGLLEHERDQDWKISISTPTSIVTPSLGGSTVSWISLITFEGKIEWTRKIILPPRPRACSGIRQGWVSSWRQRTRAWWKPQCAPGSSNGGATFPQTARITFQIWWSCSNQNRQ